MADTTDDLTTRDDLLTGVVVVLCRRLADARGIATDGRELLIEATVDELLAAASEVGVQIGVSTDRHAVLVHVTPPTVTLEEAADAP